MRFQFGQELRIAFHPRHQTGQTSIIAGRKISGVILAQQTDIARYTRGDDRRSRDNRLGDNICPALQAGGMDSQLAAHQDLSYAPLGLLADPFVTRVDLHLAARAFGHLFVHRAAHVDDSDAR